ncbi:protein of unknown function [Taphrina deformans PYCC 5710]|uniref:Uncharacterized protein n=1 Tax=Taphrina deformans (strain PYCC 5710 / ATCC 11124 / CBS 356.35 / IMI 108563 / JCM 9778 / NBRC 8474) TaxID=1097556 RepID=R4X947_TAPDE|nr:protein of unknown function [Taphrina deformans PYCC 5710]|eukprot:CCG80687.1 protein of unknown function [Taphrina deformans PYCC 5710]
MKEVADKYQAAFGILIFFGPQTLVQLYWLYKLYMKPNTAESEDSDAVRYAPFFILGNICIGIWMVFWNNERLDLSNIAVCINSFSHLLYVTTLLPPMNSKNALTHIVAKMFAGIGILDFFDNTASAYFVGQQPGNLVYAATLIGSVLATASSDAIMGSCVVYDLLALTAGQTGTWQQVLGLSAGITGLMTAYKIYTNNGFVKRVKDSSKDL